MLLESNSLADLRKQAGIPPSAQGVALIEMLDNIATTSGLFSNLKVIAYGEVVSNAQLTLVLSQITHMSSLIPKDIIRCLDQRGTYFRELYLIYIAGLIDRGCLAEPLIKCLTGRS